MIITTSVSVHIQYFDLMAVLSVEDYVICSQFFLSSPFAMVQECR